MTRATSAKAGAGEVGRGAIPCAPLSVRASLARDGGWPLARPAACAPFQRYDAAPPWRPMVEAPQSMLPGGQFFRKRGI